VNGINAITIREDDQLIEVKLTDGHRNIMLASKFGKAIRFNESKVREMGRTAAGVRGMKIDLKGGDEIIGMIIDDPLDQSKTILVVSERGYGKRSEIEDYRVINRGGKGMKNMQLTEKTGQVVSIKSVSEEDNLMITTKNGIVIRMNVNDIRVMGRATQGVKVIRLDDNDSIADIAVINSSTSDEEE
ncbi:MAG: DNA gyrase subunit A, partial [Saprospiraceae bacterium]|nr:DNA gyrase subunit A [Saprospiraceae bacterium]